jgi:hypothetical protein
VAWVAPFQGSEASAPLPGRRVSPASYTVLLWYLASVADADARELDRRLLHLELVVSRLAEQVKQLVEDVNALRHAWQEVGRDV